MTNDQQQREAIAIRIAADPLLALHTPVSIGAQPIHHAQHGLRRLFATATDAHAYDIGYMLDPDGPEPAIDTPQWRGFQDAGKVRDERASARMATAWR